MMPLKNGRLQLISLKIGNYLRTDGQPCPSRRGSVENERRRLLLARAADKAVRRYVNSYENWVKTRKYDVYISSVVVDEINATPNLLHRQKLLDVLNQYPLQYVDIEQSDDIAFLAELYIAHRIIPQKKVADALHIAIATVNRMDILLSWNYRHLANVQRKHQVQMVNIARNYVSP